MCEPRTDAVESSSPPWRTTAAPWPPSSSKYTRLPSTAFFAYDMTDPDPSTSQAWSVTGFIREGLADDPLVVLDHERVEVDDGRAGPAAARRVQDSSDADAPPLRHGLEVRRVLEQTEVVGGR